MRRLLVLAALASIFAAPLWGKDKFVCGTCVELKSGAAPKAALVAPSTNWTTGNKRVALLRLEFPDRPQLAPDEQLCRDMMAFADRVMRTNSYGALSLTSTISPMLKLPKNRSEFTNDFDIEATAWELAAQSGIRKEDFDLDVYVGWGGVVMTASGVIGGRGVYMNFATMDGTIVHELGHNLGLVHANSWVGDNDSISGSGFNREYGDAFDVMGQNIPTFNSWNRHRLGWFPSSAIRNFEGTGTFDVVLYEIASLNQNVGYVARVPAGEKTFWIDCQKPTTGGPSAKDGILLRWEPWEMSLQGTQLLDMVPETTYTSDATLLLGKTFSDHQRQIHITPIARTRNGFTVEVKRGDFPDNRPPIITPSINDVAHVAVLEELVVSATATDPDGDPVNLIWYFGDGNYGVGPRATNVYHYDAEFSVRCEAYDGKGGVAIRSFVARVGSPNSYRFAGTVTRKGVPLANARIYQPGQENASAYSGPDGRYVLPGLSVGSQPFKGAYRGVALRPKFGTPYTVTGTREEMDWEYPEITADNLNVAVLEDAPPTAIQLTGLSASGSMTFDLAELPQHGLLTGFAPNLQYMPDPNFTGQDSFSYYVRDGEEQSPPATVTIQVNAMPDAPLILGRASGRAEVLWSTRFPSEPGQTQFIYDACVGDDGQTYAVSIKPGVDSSDIEVRCFGGDGTARWSRVLDFARYDGPELVRPVRDGVLVVGKAMTDSCITRLTSTNSVRWTYQRPGVQFLIGEARGDDALLLAGSESGAPFIAKLDSATGQESWRKPAPAKFFGGHIDVADDGTFAVTGSIDMGGGGLGQTGDGLDCVTLKFSADGELIWTRQLGGRANEAGAQVYNAGDGSVYVLASSLKLIRYRADGDQLWQGDAGSPVVFDSADVPHFLANDNSTGNQRAALFRMTSATPQRVWISTNEAPNMPISFRFTETGHAQIISAFGASENVTLWVTTLDPSGQEISSVPLRHVGGFVQWLKIRSGGDSGFFVIDGGPYGGYARITRVVHEAMPLPVTVARDGSMSLASRIVPLDKGALVATIVSPPQHGAVSGAWPNLIYTPAAGYSGKDQLTIRAGNIGLDASEGVLKINVVEPPQLRITIANALAHLSADPSGVIYASRDLKNWFSARGQTAANGLNITAQTGTLYFKAIR
jgi:hypothetical protein